MPSTYINRNNSFQSIYRQYSQNENKTPAANNALKKSTTFNNSGKHNIKSNELQNLKQSSGNVSIAALFKHAFQKFTDDNVINAREGEILAYLLGTDSNSFWTTYDTDNSGTIEGSELNQLAQALRFSRNTGTSINPSSSTPDGVIGPASQQYDDCWFMSCLSAVANDEDGRQILAQNITEVDGGYRVAFAGLPGVTCYVSSDELQKGLHDAGGDADSRLMELAATKLFSVRGNFKAVFLYLLSNFNLSSDEAQAAFESYCNMNNITDPMTHNPMVSGGIAYLGYFMLTGMISDSLASDSESESGQLSKNDVISFLNEYFTNDTDGTSVVISGINNPLGQGGDNLTLSVLWDQIRTDINSSNGTEQKAFFLSALYHYLNTGSDSDLQTLSSAADNLDGNYYNEFVSTLSKLRNDMSESQIDVLRSAVLRVYNGDSGYIGFPGGHAGTITGIDAASGTYTYTEANFPDVEHYGDLDDLIESVISGDYVLGGLEPES